VDEVRYSAKVLLEKLLLIPRSTGRDEAIEKIRTIVDQINTIIEKYDSFESYEDISKELHKSIIGLQDMPEIPNMYERPVIFSSDLIRKSNDLLMLQSQLLM